MASLKKVAIIGGVIALGGAGYFQLRIQANFRQQPFYVESIRLLYGYPPALRMLGEPLKVKNLDLGDTEKTWTDGLNSRLAIPLKGQLAKATLHSWASRKTVKDKWEVDRLDLEMNNNCRTFYKKPVSDNSQGYEQNETSTKTADGEFLYLNPDAK